MYMYACIRVRFRWWQPKLMIMTMAIACCASQPAGLTIRRVRTAGSIAHFPWPQNEPSTNRTRTHIDQQKRYSNTHEESGRRSPVRIAWFFLSLCASYSRSSTLSLSPWRDVLSSQFSKTWENTHINWNIPVEVSDRSTKRNDIQRHVRLEEECGTAELYNVLCVFLGWYLPNQPQRVV